MKLIPLIILLTSLAVDVKPQKFRQELFPPQFQTPNVGIYQSDSSLYLPPESHTTIPYFPMKNMNNLQYPFLPPTGTKAPSIYPTPFPFVISTTLVPHFEDDDDDEDHGRIRLSSNAPPSQQRNNQTEKKTEPAKEKREMRTMPNMGHHQLIQNRNDIKFPFKMAQPPNATPPTEMHQTPANRRMIIGPETPKADFGIDQKPASSFLGPQFLPAGGGLYVSSTTEPAIPILRLSNEMDLDGSFSYEALGADQTHYVQHSRMENMGTDKQEQVVEGSYSYVGDNGQTYTVHYIADSNGFRASGDHLPVAPPVPEIIQRAVQYNLAEEAKKPPHLKSWQDDGKENQISDSDITHQYSLPTRNLFTGRNPEAFSYNFAQGSNTQNNLVAQASTQVPIKTVDYTTEQSKPKPNNGPISPQITFLASQGAHVPSMNTLQNAISRMFTTDKPLMPQLVNYEAGVKEAEQDPNKGLWRWQYGMHANNLNQNPTQNKDTISRSFGEGDDIIINFSDMTPDQYTKMMRSQFEYGPENIGVQSSQYIPNQQVDDNQNKHLSNFQQYHETSAVNQNLKPENKFTPKNVPSPSSPDPPTVSNLRQSDNWYNQVPDYSQPQEEDSYQEPQIQSTNKPVDESRRLLSPNTPMILTHKDFVFPSQTVTQSYNYEDTEYEPRKIKAVTGDGSIKSSTNVANNLFKSNEKSVAPNNFWQNTESEDKKSVASNNFWQNTESEVKETTTQKSYISSVSNLKFTDFIVQDSKNDFKPIVTTTTSTEAPRVETTTENNFEDILENNIFLKNLFGPQKTNVYSEKPETYKTESTENLYNEQTEIIDSKVSKESQSENNEDLFQTETETINTMRPVTAYENKVPEESKKIIHVKIHADPKTDKIPKIVQYQSQPVNDIKLYKKKPLDVAEVLNYVSMKNHFESNKVKAKSKPISNNFDQRNEIRFIPIQQDREQKESSIVSEQKNNLRTLNQEQKEELRGIIKNYKVLHRNNNSVKYDSSPLKRELSPPPLKSPNLPPLGRAGPSMKSYLPPIFV